MRLARSCTFVIPTRDLRPPVLALAAELGAWKVSDQVVVVVDGPETSLSGFAVGPRTRVLFAGMHLGPAYCRNLGARHAESELISFHDDDDLRFEAATNEQVGRFVAEDAQWGYAQVVSEPGGQVTPFWLGRGDIFEPLLTENPIPLLSVLVRTPIYRGVGGFSPAAEPLSDWDLWMRIGFDYEVVSHPLVVGRYRLAGTTTGQHSSRLDETISAWIASGRCEMHVEAAIRGGRARQCSTPYAELLRQQRVRLAFSAAARALNDCKAGLAANVESIRRIEPMAAAWFEEEMARSRNTGHSV